MRSDLAYLPTKPPLPHPTTVTETSPPTSPRTQKKARIVVRKPNPDDKSKTLNEIDERIAQLRSQLDAVREAISALGDKKGVDPRTELRKRLNELWDLQAAHKKGKQAKLDQLNTLNAALKKKMADLKVIQDKLPFKTVEAVDAQILKLTKQVESGKLKLVDEKRPLSEISTLTKSKKSFTLLQGHQRLIDADKSSISTLKTSLETADEAFKPLADEYTTLQTQVDEISRSKDEAWKKRNELFDERTRLQREMDVAFGEKKGVNDALLQDEQVRRREEAQQKRQLELEEKRMAIAREELELAEIPAFQQEITACDSVYRYLLQFSHDQNRVAAANAPATTGGATNGLNNANNLRQVDTKANMTMGMMLAKKADKLEDEVFFVGGGRKSTKTTKAPKEKMADSAHKPHHHYYNYGCHPQFELKVTVPRSPADLEKTLDALLEKSTTPKANQATATAENKRKAEERIAKLTLADIESESESESKAIITKTTITTAVTTITSIDTIEQVVERTEIVPEIQATASENLYNNSIRADV
ncbi:hypothetical protein BGX33_007624 [Mortierella sp. NVP41]|nr:hypothetical protein BGX33_007624 [Mortierella sp. NVP41]